MWARVCKSYIHSMTPWKGQTWKHGVDIWECEVHYYNISVEITSDIETLVCTYDILVLNPFHITKLLPSDMGALKRPIPALHNGSSILTFPEYLHYFVPFMLVFNFMAILKHFNTLGMNNW